MTSGDRGSGTVLVLGLMAVVLVASLGGVLVAAAARAAQVAATAADLGALAGAEAWLVGTADACAVARDVVSTNAGRLVSCHVRADDSVQVAVEVDAAVVLQGVTAPARAVARAGPTPDPLLVTDSDSARW